MKHNLLVYFFLVLSAAIGTVFAHPEGGRALAKRTAQPIDENWTNAQRLARGLPPRAPRSLYNPSRVAARTPQTSSVPQITGRIKVRKASNGAFLGYVKSTLLSSGRYTITGSSSSSATFKFTPGTGPFNIQVISNANYPYLGLNDPSNRNFLVQSNPTSPNSTPSNVGNSGGGQSQSAVWSYSTSNGKLTVQYVRPNGVKTTGSPWYEDNGGSEGLGVGSKPSGAVDVEFYFDQI